MLLSLPNVLLWDNSLDRSQLLFVIDNYSQGGAGPRWSVSPLHEVEEETNVDEHLVQLPQPSTETAEEVAGRLRSKLKSGEFQNEYKDLLTVKASSAPVQSAYVGVCL